MAVHATHLCGIWCWLSLVGGWVTVNSVVVELLLSHFLPLVLRLAKCEIRAVLWVLAKFETAAAVGSEAEVA